MQATLDELAQEVLNEEMPADKRDATTAMCALPRTSHPGGDVDTVVAAEHTRN